MGPMTNSQREAFLKEPRVGILSINHPGHGPLTVPIWFDYTPGYSLWFLTGRDSMKARLLETGIRISLVSQIEQPPYGYVSVEGPVFEINSASRQDLLAMAIRYLGPDGGERYNSETEEYQADNGILVRVRPERWLSVDYS